MHKFLHFNFGTFKHFYCTIYTWDSYMNLCGILNLLIEVLSMVGFYKLWKRRKYIKSEQQLFE